jgi:hypothetical protein
MEELFRVSFLNRIIGPTKYLKLTQPKAQDRPVRSSLVGYPRLHTFEP